MKISEIIIDENIYPRKNVDIETISRYCELLKSGAKLPPLVVMPDGRLLDGRHRYEAYKQAGVEEVEVIVEVPVNPDARAVELNLSHGRPLSREELREAARRWYGKMPVTEISKILGVTRQTVQNWVPDLAEERQSVIETIRGKALEMRAEGKTQEEVAGELGVTRQAVSKWESNSVKNLTPLHVKNPISQPLEDESDEEFESLENEDNQKDNQEKEFTNPGTVQEVDPVKAIKGRRIETHYRTGGIVSEVSGPREDGYYTIVYKHPLNGKKCWINSITVKDNAVLCEGVPLRITEATSEESVPDNETGHQAEEDEKKLFSGESNSNWDKCKTCPCYQVDGCEECEHKNNPLCHDLYPDDCTDEYCEKARAARDSTPQITDIHTENHETGKTEFPVESPETGGKKETQVVDKKSGQAVASEFRKKVLPYSDMVKEYYNQLKKTSELAEQLVNRREDLIAAIADMQADGVSITVLANAAVQACDIYIPRLNEARDVLEEVIKPGVKGIVARERFMVVKGGKKDGG